MQDSVSSSDRFLYQESLRSALQITDDLEQIMRKKWVHKKPQIWEVSDLTHEQKQELYAFLSHIRGVPQEELSESLDSREISVEIINFWTLECARYVVAKNSLILDLTQIIDRDNLLPQLQEELQTALRYLGDEHIQISPQHVQIEERVFITTQAESHLQSFLDLPRKILPLLPNAVLDWQRKQEFDRNCRAIGQVQQMEGLHYQIMKRACLYTTSS